MSRVKTKIEPRYSSLQRLAIVLAEPLRMKIVTELFLREMSPTLFYEEFGGGSVSRVARHFETLATHGWLRFIRKETGGRRYGGVEHFYRASELAIISNEAWAEVPYSIRAALSSTVFEQFAERVAEAMEAGTFDARVDRHFSLTPVLLDELGWERMFVAINDLFESIQREQADAKIRVFESEEKPILATVALGGFESPLRDPGGARRAGPNLAEAIECAVPFTRRLSKVFADLLCLKIVTELNTREMSATQFYRELGGPSRSAIHRRFKTLSELGWLRHVGEETGGHRRGATEQFYRATAPPIVDGETWSKVPDSVRASCSWSIFEQLSDRVKEAMEAGTLDARTDRHLSWSLLLVDQRGWENIMAALETFFASILVEQDGADQRLAESGDEAINMTIALASFESPKDLTRAP